MSGACEPVVVENSNGSGPFVILCDHASNRIPDDCRQFGFAEDALQTHIAWDPGALAVARLLSAHLDAPLIWPDVSRLVIDCNRAPDVATLIVTESEGRPVAANAGLSVSERARRLDTIHGAYHAAIEACLAQRRAEHVPTSLIAIHSYTPVFFGKASPWQVGIVFDDDRRLADRLISGLEADPALTVGVNEPYSRGFPAAMIEIRNDEIDDATGQRIWANRLAGSLLAAERDVVKVGHATV